MKTLATLLMAVAGFALLGWLAQPMWGDIQLLRDQIASIESVLSTLSKTKDLQQELITKYNSITDAQLDRLLNQHLPKKPDTGNLLIALERISSVNNAKLNNIDFKKVEQQRQALSVPKGSLPVVAPNPYQEIAFSFGVTSSYENFKTLLTSLENHVRLIDVTNITFAGSVKDSYTFTLTAKTYFRK